MNAVPAPNKIFDEILINFLLVKPNILKNIDKYKIPPVRNNVEVKKLVKIPVKYPIINIKIAAGYQA